MDIGFRCPWQQEETQKLPGRHRTCHEMRVPRLDEGLLVPVLRLLAHRDSVLRR